MKPLDNQQEYNTEKLIRKLLYILVAVTVIAILILLIGPGLGGNYMKSINSMLWMAPLGCIIWGFLWAALLAFIPFKGLPYKRKYLITSLFISILFNVFMCLIGVTEIFKPY
jgi:hypothetical protein